MKNIIQYTIGLLAAAGVIAANTAIAQSKQTKAVAADTTVQQLEEGVLLKVRKRESLTANPSVPGTVLYKTPVANLSNTLYGTLQGLSVLQRSGEPGYDDAQLNVRGIGTYDNTDLPIYVDGFQTPRSYFSYLSPAEIESITLLKDAVSLATLGMKGANGALWVVTKRGQAGKSKITAQVVNGWQKPTMIDKPYGSYDYARLYNIAQSNDNYSLNGNQYVWSPKYSDAALQSYKDGTGTNVDWYNEVLKKNGGYTDANVNFSGGNQTSKYGLIFDYMNQRGMYNVLPGYTSSSAQIQRYNIRSNLDFNFFKIFEAKVDIGGRIEDRKYPNYNGPTLWSNMATYPSNIYPVRDSLSGFWSGTTTYPNNPVASINALGWAATHDRTLQANFNLKEKLDFITPGLYLNEAVSFNTWSRNSSSKTATYARFNNGVNTTTDKTTNLVANDVSAPTSQYDWKQFNLTAGYDKTIGLHSVSAAAGYYVSNYQTDWNNNFSGLNRVNNIFYHYENISGRVHYAYNDKYLAEVAFGYSGSDNYAPGNRWGFYPAVSLGWVASNESFLKDNSLLTYLKVRATAGKSGSDQSNQGRYLYQQYYGGNGTYYTGGSSLTGNTGVAPSYTANPNIFAEQSVKYDAGVDFTLFKKLSVTADVFMDKRSGIVTYDNSLMATYGATAPYRNVGKVTNKGYEISAQYNDNVGGFNYSLGGALMYAKNKVDYMAEIPTLNDFSKQTGLSIGSPIGLVAQGLYDITDFNTDGTLKNGLPTPSFGSVQPGDIKYADLDGNGRVDQFDVTKIGNPSAPSLYYSFNAQAAYKGFDLSVLFQGASGNQVNLITAAYNQTVAFVNNTNVYPIAGNAWAYYPSQDIDTRATADYPRLTTKTNNNNYQNSTFWMRNGAFLRLRNVELGYTLPASVLRKMRLDKLRIYASAVNPLTWSYLSKHYNMDPETITGYPGLKSFNAGISLTF